MKECDRMFRPALCKTRLARAGWRSTFLYRQNCQTSRRRGRSCIDALEQRAFLSAVPAPDHVVVVIEENHSYEDVIGNPQMPYVNSLAQQGASFTSAYALFHPSQPNYLALFSGSNQEVIDNLQYDFF